ncbi:thermonuclease family protein [Pelagibacterium xiamenense]|uniref:thermonuclease family protein n=1 Tax=Pelagibacterium xiamenense TaxID=2901140 RepID=UPI001E62E212|nr:thermonuclease family protein [Pelagibacterium xiamenense]MCD7061282.1 thermonuclease family protein [Pelagibacterium xiamenense]
MLNRLLVTVLGLSTLWTLPAHAQVCAALTVGPSARVVSISDGDTVDLDTGLTVRLVGMQAPKLPLGREGFEAWPLGDEAKAALSALVLHQEVTLYYGGETRDRHGRALAHVFVSGEDGPIWVQAEMLERGLARVYSFPDNRSCLAELYAAERSGRAEGLGIWRDAYYALRDATDVTTLLDRVGGYELVEGRVLNADKVGDRVYLNFGRYWKEDFTVVIDAAGLRVFQLAGIDPLALEGRLIRVRGWIESHDGPRMEVTHPEQIEILGV